MCNLAIGKQFARRNVPTLYAAAPKSGFCNWLIGQDSIGRGDLKSRPPAPKAGALPKTTVLFSTFLLKQNNLVVILACGWLCLNVPTCLLGGHKTWHISDGARLIVNFLTDDNIQKASKPRRAAASDLRSDKKRQPLISTYGFAAGAGAAARAGGGGYADAEFHFASSAAITSAFESTISVV